MTSPLTTRQAEVLRAIATHYRDHGVPPTLRDLCAALGIKSINGVVSHLTLLAAKGAIAWDRDRTARGVCIPSIEAATRKAAAEFLKGVEK